VEGGMQSGVEGGVKDCVLGGVAGGVEVWRAVCRVAWREV
jgi:hypothetical protein